MTRCFSEKNEKDDDVTWIAYVEKPLNRNFVLNRGLQNFGLKLLPAAPLRPERDSTHAAVELFEIIYGFCKDIFPVDVDSILDVVGLLMRMIISVKRKSRAQRTQHMTAQKTQKRIYLEEENRAFI